MVCYLILLLLCILAVRRAHRLSPAADVPQGTSPLSVVVCVHAEPVRQVADGLRSVASSLSVADELIVVADRVPSDRMPDLRSVVESLGGRLVENAFAPGKKGAQRTGVLAASHSVVVCTDADCRVALSFADAVRCRLPRDGRPFMVLLPVLMCGSPTLFGRMVEMEFVCLQMVTAGTALMGFPSMANGAGMAFSRDLYLSHDQKDAYASGDDMFLLQHAIRTGADVRFALSPDALVKTSAPDTLSAYLRQRARWLGKSGGYTSWSVRIVAVAVLLANLVAPLALSFGVWQLFAVKLVADALTFTAGRSVWRSRVPLWVALPLEVLYLPMIVAVGVRSLRMGRREW